MKGFRKCLVILLISALLLNTAQAYEETESADAAATNAQEDEGFSVPDIISAEELEEKQYVGRIKEEEHNLYSFVFQNADGTSTLRMFQHPVKYIGSDGDVKDITTLIKRNSNGSFETKDNSISTHFSRFITDGISLAGEQVNIKMVPILEAESMRTLSKASMSKDGKRVSYPYDENTTLEYSLTYTGFKEDIVVNKYTGKNQYGFYLYTNGLAVREMEGEYCLVDALENVKATIGDIIVFTADEKNNTRGTLLCEELDENEKYKISICIDNAYLMDEKTKYPIRIDPTIEISYSTNGAGAIDDTTINSSAGSLGTSGSLFVGKRSSEGISRVLMRFPGLSMSSLPGAHQIVSASVELRDLMCESNAMNVSCYVFNGNAWSSSNATWSSVDANNYTMLLSTQTISYANGSKKEPVHRYSFDILSAVRGWKSGTYSQAKGIIFKANANIEGGSTYTYKTFASYNRSAYQPSLSITYRSVTSAIQIAELPYKSSRTIYANGCYKFAFTPTASGKYSFCTRGSTDTSLYGYGNSSLSTLLGSNTNGGHGTNACLTLSLTAGKTYYILLQGNSATTTGTTTFEVNRGLPLSGDEQPKNFGDFNDPGYKENTNCYNYAIYMYLHPITGGRFGENGADPGEIAGNLVNVKNYSNAASFKTAVVAAVKRDCVAWGGTESDFYEVSENTMVPAGYYKVALVWNPGEDYHWFRQVSDLNGAWAHKIGRNEATEKDNSGNLIFEPSAVTINDYTEFLGYFAFRHPSKR